MSPLELLALCRYVHPETSFPSDRAGTLNLEANNVGGVSGWWQVDVCAWDVRGADVCQWQLVDSLGGPLSSSHVCKSNYAGKRRVEAVDWFCMQDIKNTATDSRVVGAKMPMMHR